MGFPILKFSAEYAVSVKTKNNSKMAAGSLEPDSSNAVAPLAAAA